jgi:hypothetical protein
MYYCFKEGLYIQGILHDLNKFRLSSIKAYARYFYLENGKGKFVRDKSGYYDASNTGNDDFDRAWLHHQNTNKHHWQYWCMRKEDGTMRCLDIPNKYIVEMLCDWRGAGRAQGTNPDGNWKIVAEYYIKNRDKMFFTNDTRYDLERAITNRYDIYITGWN